MGGVDDGFLRKDPDSEDETTFWLAQPRVLDDIAEAERDIAAGHTLSVAAVRRTLGLPDGPASFGGTFGETNSEGD
jgi:hypothetical protein